MNNSTGKIKIIIADDDRLILDSLGMIFSLEPDLEVVGLAADGNEAVFLCRRHKPDIVLMDIRMPQCDGIQATRMIKSELGQTRVVMLTTFNDEEYISAALQAGAEGYLLKSAPADGIIERLRAVNSGATVLEGSVAAQLTARGRDKRTIPTLTERENEVTYLIAQGYSNKEIAHLCHLGEGTVRNTISVILEKLSLRDRTQLAVRYWRG